MHSWLCVSCMKGWCSQMVKIYVELIKKGLKSIEDVPEKLRQDVQNYLDGEG